MKDGFSRRTLLGTVCGLGAVAVGSAGHWSVWRDGPLPITEHLTVADSKQVLSALFYVALAKKYFASVGLAVDVVSFKLGRDAMAGVLAGKADLTMASEMPLMEAFAGGHPIKAIATLGTSDSDLAVIARKDHGIATPKDLNGKRIGYIPGSGSQILLHLFILANELSAMPVKLKADEVVPSLLDGQVDAVSCIGAIVRDATVALGDSATIFESKSLYIRSWALAVASRALQENGTAVAKFLKALILAEQFALTNREEAVAIVAEHAGVSRAELARDWSGYGFSIQLSHTLMINLEHAARVEKRTGPDGRPLNFITAVEASVLRSVDASRVSALQ